MPARIVTALAATACLALGAQTFGVLTPGALAAPRTQALREGGTNRIVVYDSLCDEDNAVECLIAEVGCTAPGEFTAVVYGLDAGEAASVFAKGKGSGGGKASLAAGADSFVLQVSKVALSEHSYNWDVTALSLEQGRAVWVALWNASEIRLQAGTRKAVIRRAEVDENAFREVVSACGAASR